MDRSPVPPPPSVSISEGPSSLGAGPRARHSSAATALYERSAWAYVFEHACRAGSPYTASQRLVLLAIARRMGTRIAGRPVSFITYRTLAEETGLGRTAIKDAIRGIKRVEPALMRMERARNGGRMQTNGVLHGCYRFTLLLVPRHRKTASSPEGYDQDSPEQARKHPKPDDAVEIARRMMAARAEHFAECVSVGLPQDVADFLMDVAEKGRFAENRLATTSQPHLRRLVLHQLISSNYRQVCVDGCSWGIEFDASQSGWIKIDGETLDVPEIGEALANRRAKVASKMGSAADPTEGRQAAM